MRDGYGWWEGAAGALLALPGLRRGYGWVVLRGIRADSS
jgi:hypothetical protein